MLIGRGRVIKGGDRGVRGLKGGKGVVVGGYR